MVTRGGLSRAPRGVQVGRNGHDCPLRRCADRGAVLTAHLVRIRDISNDFGTAKVLL